MQVYFVSTDHQRTLSAINHWIRCDITDFLCPRRFRNSEGVTVFHDNDSVIVGNRIVFDEGTAEGSHLLWRAKEVSTHIGAITAVIHQRTCPVFLFIVEPFVEVAGASDFLRSVVCRTPFEVENITDCAVFDKIHRGIECRTPCGGPVHHQQGASVLGSSEHLIRLRKTRRHRLFGHDVDTLCRCRFNDVGSSTVLS